MHDKCGAPNNDMVLNIHVYLLKMHEGFQKNTNRGLKEYRTRLK